MPGTNNHSDTNRRSPLLPPPQPISIQKLHEIIKDHEEWVISGKLHGTRAKLINMQLAGFDFRGRNLSRAHFELCDLQNADFTESQLIFARINSCELDNADFSSSIAIGCQFMSSYALNALFKGADLTNACFMFAKLNAADFSYSNLSCADFEDAEFQGANFRGANISGVNLARWYLNLIQLKDSVSDGNTKISLSINKTR